MSSSETYILDTYNLVEQYTISSPSFKIADFLKELCNAIRTYISGHNLSVTTRSTMEMSEERAKELRQQFLDAMDKAVENYQKAEKGKASKNEGTHFSLVGVDKNGIEVYETSEETKKLSYAERKAKLLDLMKHEYAGRTAKFEKNGQVYYAQYNTASLNKGVHGDKKSDHKGYNAKINIGADGNYIELAENALYKGSSTEQGKSNKFHSDAKQWDYYVKTIQSDGVYFDVLINVKDTGKEQYVYDITLKEATHQRALKHLRLGEAASNSRIPQNQKNATKRFSLAVDSQGRELTKEQIEYFKNSKVRDAEGNLLEVYHGTNSEQFTVFDSSKSSKKIRLIVLGNGFYFAPNKDKAEKYGQRVMNVYLNMKNPYRFNGRTGGILAQLEDDFGVSADSTKRSEIQGILKENGFDGVLMYQSKYDEPSDFVTAVVFDSNQIKKVDNYNPTQNEDIRYSLNLSDYLGASEIDMFWEKIGERKRGTQFPKSRNGDSILTIGNKLVYTGRGYQNPKANKIVEVIVTEDSEYETTYTSFIQEDIINEYERKQKYAGTSFEDFARVERSHFTSSFGREVIIREEYGENRKSDGKNGLVGKGQVRQRAYYNFADEQNGRGDTGESEGSSSLRYSLNDATDFSDFC